MKNKILIAMILIFGGIAANGFAQDVAMPKKEPGINQQDQMKTIFSFKDKIGLTDDQEVKLKALLYDEQSSLESSNNTLKGLGAELAKMVEDKADMASIRSKLEDISKIQVDASCRNIEDSRKIETILSPDQLAKWKDIQKSFAAQAQS